MDALAGIRVVDFSKWLPGQYCGMVLGDYGADVIKVEDVRGDATRAFIPVKEPGLSYWHLGLNRNKRGITVNLKTKEGCEILKRLLAEADVFLEGFRPGYLATKGLDYESIKAINPRLVYCSITGFGQEGPYRHKPAHDLNVIGLSGLNSLEDTGGACISEVQVSALGSSLNAVAAITMALFARERTKEGQHLDINLYATALGLQATGVASAVGCREQGTSPFGRTAHYYNIYKTKDGRFLSVGTIEPKFWERFCRLIDREDLIDRQYDFAKEAELTEQLQTIIAGKTREEWVQLVGSGDFCVTPVLSLQEAMESDMTKESGMLLTKEEDIGRLTYLKPALGMSATPGSIRRRAPKLGEHNQQVLTDLGYSPEEQARLREQGAI